MKEKATNPIINISIFNSIIKMLQVSISFFLGIYFVEINFSGAEIGIIFAVTTLTSIITVLPSGFSSDSFKSKHLISIGLLLIGIQYAIFSVTTNFYLITVLFLVGGIGNSLYSTASESLFYKSTKNSSVSKKIGIFHGLRYLAIGLGMILAGQLLYIDFPFSFLFQIIATSIAIMIIIGFFILPENKTAKFEILHYKKDILRPKVLFFLLIMFLFAIHFGAEQTSYGLFLKNTLELNSQQIGLYMGIAIITMSIASTIIATKLHKWKVKNILLFGLLVSGSGHILMSIFPPIPSFIFRVIHEVGDAAMFFFLFYGITKLFDMERIGGNAGVFRFVATIGGAIGALTFGPIGQIYGYHIPLIASGIITLLSFIMALQFTNLIEHKQ